MSPHKHPFKNVRLVYRRSSPVLKCAVLAALLLSTAALLTLRSSISSEQESVRQLQEQAVVLQQQNSQLQDDIADLGSPESIRNIATQKLGLTDPATKFFSPAD